MAVGIGAYEKKPVKIRCTDNGKIVTGDMIKMSKDSITVVLHNSQKMVLVKGHKPNFYITQMFGMEFTCNLLEK